MAITIAVPQESAAGEKRVALVPAVVSKLAKNATINMAKNASAGIAMPDDAFADASIVDNGFDADIVLKVQPPTVDEVKKLREGSIIISFMAPHANADMVKALCQRNITAFGMELVPRISRAQAMDALSSQAAVAGYKAVLIGASKLGRFFPMLTTAAGTIRPAKTLVIGAGVAGLQAIATARRLGAMVEAYDVRAATKEQVESLGAKFVDVGVAADGDGGYARELTDEEKAKQQEILANHVAQADVVITTAAIPGRPAPKIITTAMVERMKTGAVVVDIAAETGGNCELTQAGEDVIHNNVIVHGPVNLPSSMAEHASEMYAKNLQNLLDLMLKDGELTLDWEDEVIAGSCLTHAGEIKHEPTKTAIEG